MTETEFAQQMAFCDDWMSVCETFEKISKEKKTTYRENVNLLLFLKFFRFEFHLQSTALIFLLVLLCSFKTLSNQKIEKLWIT